MSAKENGPAAASPGRLTTLDALRGAASLLVLFYHLDDVLVALGADPPFGGLGHGGARGVDFLFVLSGYVMARVYLMDRERRTSATAFLRQRAQRLLPAFWTVSLAALALYVAGYGGMEKATKLEPLRLLASFLLLPQDHQPLLNVSWFLVYEAFFYLLVALALFDRRIGFAAIFAWQGLVLALLLAGQHVGPSEVPNYLSPRCLGLGIGIAFAMLGRRIEQRCGLRAMSFAFVAAAGLFLGDMVWEGIGERDTHGLPILLLDLAAGTVLLTVTTLERRGGWKAPRPLAALGSISYSVYLTHFAVLTLSVRFIASLGMPVGQATALACAVAALAVGASFHRWLDAPVQSALRGRQMARKAETRRTVGVEASHRSA